MEKYNVNYFCTDGLDIYSTKRFTSNRKKEEKYFNEEYYRKIDKKIELIPIIVKIIKQYKVN